MDVIGTFTLRDPVAGSGLRDADNDSFRSDAVPPPPPPLPPGSFPALTVELGHLGGWTLGTSLLGVDTFLGPFVTSWDDMTPKTLTLSINRGRNHELDRNESGTASDTLLNQEGEFLPTNTAGPHYPDIRPGIPIRMTATQDFVTYPLFRGFAEAWPATWSGASVMGLHEVQLEVVDGMKSLNLARVTLARPVEQSGARINAMLDAAGWSGTRAIDTGSVTVQSVELENTGILAHIQDVAASEGGQFFISADGTATFYAANHALALDPGDIWGDADGEMHYASITTSYDDSQIWNEIVVTAPDLENQIVRDEASITLYGLRTLTVPTLLTSTTVMLDRANALLTRYSEPHLRITSMTIDNASLDTTQWARLFSKEVHDRVLVRKRPAFADIIEQPSFVESIRWDIQPGRWLMRWGLSSAALQVGQWQLGVVGLSELGVTTTVVGL